MKATDARRSRQIQAAQDEKRAWGVDCGRSGACLYTLAYPSKAHFTLEVSSRGVRSCRSARSQTKKPPRRHSGPAKQPLRLLHDQKLWRRPGYGDRLSGFALAVAHMGSVGESTLDGGAASGQVVAVLVLRSRA